MLTILYGPSCVGKTSLIRHLLHDHQWKPISCYVTRTIRDTDIGRIQVTREEFEKLEESQYFHCTNHHFDSSYGTPKNELVEATNHNESEYILDFMLKNFHQLNEFEHRKIIMLPESIENFKLQIISSQRQHRMQETLADLNENYQNKKIEIYEKQGFRVFLNVFNDINATLESFMRVLN